MHRRGSKTYLRHVVPCLLALAASSGCRTARCDASGATIASCDISSAGQCVDFSGLRKTDETTQSELCTSYGGTWGSTPCPTAGRLGSCSLPPAQAAGGGLSCSSGATILERYYPPNETAARAQGQCANVPGTTWTPG
jgi:hypothetical protein